MQPGIIDGSAGFARAGDELAAKGVRDLAIKHVERDGLHFMQSAWFPSEAELALLNRGAPALLDISAPRHPVCFLGVGQPPAHDVDDIPILYANAAMPGVDKLLVIDCATGLEVPDCVECDVQAGWARVYQIGAHGNPIVRRRRDVLAKRKIRGQFRIERRS